MFRKTWPYILLVISNVLCQQVAFRPNENQQPADVNLAPFTRIAGKYYLSCSAPNVPAGFVRSDLHMLPIKLNGIDVITDAVTGSFSVSGSFTGTVVHLEVNYDRHIISTVNGTTIASHGRRAFHTDA